MTEITVGVFGLVGEDDIEVVKKAKEGVDYAWNPFTPESSIQFFDMVISN